MVEFPTEMTIDYRDGVVQTDIEEGIYNHDTGPRIATEINFSKSSRVHGRDTLDPDENRTSSIKKFPQRFAVVIVVSEGENNITSWATVNCAESAVGGVSVSVYPKDPEGVRAGYS